MLKSMHFEDNGDGTTTIDLTDIEGEVMTLLVAMSLSEIEGMLPGDSISEVGNVIESQTTLIPNWAK